MKKEIAILCSALILLAGCTSTKTDEVTNTETQKEIPAGVTVEDAAPEDMINTTDTSTETTGSETGNTEASMTGEESTTTNTNEMVDESGMPIDENAVPGQMTTETEEATTENDTPIQN